MKEFPKFEIKSTRYSGTKCTVTLEAGTACGEKITAKATIRGDKTDTAQQLETKARTRAYANLAVEYDSVVTSCKFRGKHNH